MLAQACVPPQPPRYSVGSRKLADPAKTAKSGSLSWMIEAIWAMSPPLSLPPTMFPCADRALMTSAGMLSAVFRGML